jgi:TctA family transporter
VVETLHNLALGFSVALQPSVLAYAVLGCMVGTIVGMLPGLGPLAGISLLLPATFGLTPTTAIYCWPAFTTAPCTAVPPPRS